MHVFLFFCKTRCPGEISLVINQQNYALLTHLCLCLPCFCVPPHPYTPSHASKPIRVHLHAYAPLPTLNSFVVKFFLIFALTHACQNMSCSTIWRVFCLAFVSPREHTPHCTHLHPSSPICTHFLSFLEKITKHHVRGNFPGHGRPSRT